MRALVVLAMLVASCHPPTLQDRARQAGHQLSAVGHKIASVTVNAYDSLDPDTKQQARQAAVSAAVATVSRATVPPRSSRAAALPPAVASSPSTLVTSQRIDRAQAPSFVAHYKNAAGKWTCSAFATMAECTDNCTAIARQAVTVGAGTECNCLEGESCL
jgi:hypothetical protein